MCDNLLANSVLLEQSEKYTWVSFKELMGKSNPVMNTTIETFRMHDDVIPCEEFLRCDS